MVLMIMTQKQSINPWNIITKLILSPAEKKKFKILHFRGKMYSCIGSGDANDLDLFNLAPVSTECNTQNFEKMTKKSLEIGEGKTAAT